MARGTKKVGIAGKFGPRYGVTIRKRIRDASRARQSPQQCPECQHHAVKRESTGIWVCKHCNLKFAAAAYSTRTRSFKKDESVSISDRAYRAGEDEIAAMENASEPDTIDEPEEEPVVDDPVMVDEPDEETELVEEAGEDAEEEEEPVEEPEDDAPEESPASDEQAEEKEES